MSKPLAVFVSLAAVVLAACSSADETPSPDAHQTSVPPTNVEPDAGPGAVGCPSATAGPVKTPSPVERCEGGYSGQSGSGHALEEAYLHSDGEVCLLGTSIILHPDGRATRPAGFTAGEGSWKGDVIYFDVTFGGQNERYSPLPAKR